MKSRLSSLRLWITFVAGIGACVSSSHVLHGTRQHLATYGGIAVSLLAGSRIVRKQPIKSWLGTRPVLWFLFLFNLGVAVAAGVLVHGAQGAMTAAGMGLVSLGAGAGLLRGHRERA